MFFNAKLANYISRKQDQHDPVPTITAPISPSDPQLVSFKTPMTVLLNVTIVIFTCPIDTFVKKIFAVLKPHVLRSTHLNLSFSSIT